MSGQVELVSLQKKPHVYRYQCRHLQKFAKWSRVLEKTMIRTDLFLSRGCMFFPSIANSCHTQVVLAAGNSSI